MTKEYYATYLDSDNFNRGAFSSVEEAKKAIIEEYKKDLANGSNHADELQVFCVGVVKPMTEIAKSYAKRYRAEWFVESLCDDIDSDWSLDDPSIPSSEENIALMTELLNQFFDKCEYNFKNVIDGIEEFKFSEVIK